MAKYYLDVSVEEKLLDLYTAIHRTFVDIKSDSIGICLPNQHENKSGNTIRLIATEEHLNNFVFKFIEYVNEDFVITDILPVPPCQVHAEVVRVRLRFNDSKLRRDLKRGNVKPSQIQAFKEKQKKELEELKTLPILRVRSGSSKQVYVRNIKHNIRMKAVEGTFDSFGMSVNGSTLPLF